MNLCFTGGTATNSGLYGLNEDKRYPWEEGLILGVIWAIALYMIGTKMHITTLAPLNAIWFK